MRLDTDDIALLMRLGFSLNQAKVYLSLINLGTCTAKDICKFSGVIREEVYRKLRELVKMNLVEEILSRPTLYRAPSSKKVIQRMLKQKAIDISELHYKMDQFFNKFENGRQEYTSGLGDFAISLIPKQGPLFEKAKEMLRNVEVSIDTICTWKKGIGWLSGHKDEFLDALNRNVKIRFIIEKEKRNRFPAYLKEFIDVSVFPIRTITKLDSACLGIYDSKEVLIDTSIEEGFVDSDVLWSNNKAIVEMARIYFESFWQNLSSNI